MPHEEVERSRGRPARRTALIAAAGVLTAGAVAAAAVLAAPSAPRPDAGWQAAPYLYLGRGGPPAVQVMRATGIHRFTLAFVVAGRGCVPRWDGGGQLRGGAANTIAAVRAAGGDAAVSFGGMSGAKLAVACSSPELLARAYQEVIDVYRLRAIDLDAEGTEVTSAGVRQRIADALAIVRRGDPGLMISVTMSSGPDGPGPDERDLIRRTAAAGARVNAWTIMPFDFGAPVPDMGQAAVRAAEALRDDLMSAYRESAPAAYQTMGISSMNGRTDTGEIIRQADFQVMLRYARAHHLARFTFWSLNRDRPCPSGTPPGDSCSGISQPAYAFTRIVAGYRG